MNRLFSFLFLLLFASCSSHGPSLAPESPDSSGFASVAAATASNRGSSYLGMCSQSFPCDKALATFNSTSTVIAGWLGDFSFGKQCSCADKLLTLPKPKIVRIHVANGTCFPERGRVCEPQEVFAGEHVSTADAKIRAKDPIILGRFKERLTAIRSQLVRAARPIKCYISPTLERPFSKQAQLVLIGLTQDVFLDLCKIVDSTSGDSCIPGYVCEQHGTKAAATGSMMSQDYDGADFIYEDNYLNAQRYSTAAFTLAWTVYSNGLEYGEPFKNPLIRNHWPPDQYFRAHTYWHNPISSQISSPVNPVDKAGCSRTLPTNQGKFVWKLGTGRPFATFLPPLQFKCPSKFRNVKVVKNGKVTDTARLRGCYSEDHSNRQIWDFHLHPVDFSDNSVLNADGTCWILQKPQWRID